MGVEDWLTVNRPAKNTLVLINVFENITLCLYQLPLKFNSQIERKTRLFKAAALKEIYKANQSTNWPFKLEIVFKSLLTC